MYVYNTHADHSLVCWLNIYIWRLWYIVHAIYRNRVMVGEWVDGWLGPFGWREVLQDAGDASAVAERARERPIWRTGSPWGRCALRCSGVDNTRLASLPYFNWQFWRRARLYIHSPTCALYDNHYGIGNPLCTGTRGDESTMTTTTTTLTIDSKRGGVQVVDKSWALVNEGRGGWKLFVYSTYILYRMIHRRMLTPVCCPFKFWILEYMYLDIY